MIQIVFPKLVFHIELCLVEEEPVNIFPQFHCLMPINR